MFTESLKLCIWPFFITLVTVIWFWGKKTKKKTKKFASSPAFLTLALIATFSSHLRSWQWLPERLGLHRPHSEPLCVVSFTGKRFHLHSKRESDSPSSVYICNKHFHTPLPHTNAALVQIKIRVEERGRGKTIWNWENVTYKVDKELFL